jgi:Ca2+-binding RTX toxin-like protein
MGGAGNDYLHGGQGNDVLNGGEGGLDDIASYTDQTSGVTVNLVSGKAVSKASGKDTLINIDSVDGSDNADILTGNNQANTLQGFDGNDKINGLKGNDILLGNDGADKLKGGLGNDSLNGGAGNDTLTGGVGKDVFSFNTALIDNGIDKIVDFKPIHDTIELDSAIFTQLTIGVIDAGNFVKAADAIDTDDYLIYDRASGALSYDADGNGAESAVQIALLGTHPGLTYADFVVI